ncbi:hypothetical protein YQE_11896, partial [Dendroctonus ponderosae]
MQLALQTGQPNKTVQSGVHVKQFSKFLENFLQGNESSGNLLAIPPINQTVQEGEEAKFECVVKDITLIRVRWLKDGIALSAYQDLSRRSLLEKDGTLVIHPTDMGDYGEYECEATNQAGDLQKAKAFLNVQCKSHFDRVYKAKVVYAPPELHLPYGRPAMIDCHYRANPPLTNLRWEKDGFLFDPYNVQGVFYRKNGSLYLSQVDESHAGSYTCTPYNDLGTKAPIFTVTPHNLYLRKLGETIEIPCDARDGNNGHSPIIVWSKKGSSLPMGRYTINENNLTITEIEEGDRGIYQCSATNKAATVTAETELLVGTEYEFMVLCKDDNGGGPFSKSLRIWTQTEQQHETNLFK